MDEKNKKQNNNASDDDKRNRIVRKKVVTHPWYDDASDADSNFGSLEEAVAQVDAVPEGDEVAFYLKEKCKTG